MRRGTGHRGQHRNQPKRRKCPKCLKRGIGPWKTHIVLGVIKTIRSCRYCQNTEVQKVSSNG